MSATRFVDLIHTFDWEQTQTKLGCVTLSFFYFVCVYFATNAISYIFLTYRNLKTKEKVFWNLAVARGNFGFFAIVIGLWALFVDNELHKDVVFATTPISHFAMCTTTGFFLFECLMVLWSDIYFKQFNMLLNIHHWVSLIGYSIVLTNGSTHYLGCRGLLLEMSTPFSCLCWTLLKADLAHSFIWKANQFLLVHTFHTRSIIECYMWYITYMNWDAIWASMPAGTFYPLYLQLVLVTFIMTPYWTYKKTVQMINPVDWNFEESADAKRKKDKSANGHIKAN
ncbi:protein CLN8-like [Dreissena polymorpha]|uniref:TLC domain-containing protein n=1 Tax=Dreissena polymorpha TaxID=45954 RepID=A0A9D4MPI1_DREPO|nr:protein CLN8-like [Dreissena polymorpha]XP_052260869.1 protein CLN8-like [Dreissena polymorpha]XP_052260870.1 protein CLN8-like [Dreissena polymorpha]XP_052260871.1 protein CLN8-like [Dreissena polymorpha]KAH3880133.1 hypothetical protein DPMN_004046 [Dreissena polymorpha]